MFTLSRQLREWLRRREPKNADYQRALTIALGNVGGVSVRVARLTEAIDLYDHSIAEFQKLVVDCPRDEPSILLFVQVLQDCGDVYVRLHQFDLALIQYQLSRARLEELAARSPSDVSLQLQSTSRLTELYRSTLPSKITRQPQACIPSPAAASNSYREISQRNPRSCHNWRSLTSGEDTSKTYLTRIGGSGQL
jgi:hypothetical protein